MKGRDQLLRDVVDDVLLGLQDDAASSSWIVNIVWEEAGRRDEQYVTSLVHEVVALLLARHDVQIGRLYSDGTYTRFEAWPGTVAERLERAAQAMKGAHYPPHVGEAFWLVESEEIAQHES